MRKDFTDWFWLETDEGRDEATDLIESIYKPSSDEVVVESLVGKGAPPIQLQHTRYRNLLGDDLVWSPPIK